MVTLIEQTTVFKEIGNFDQGILLNQSSISQLINHACNPNESNFSNEIRNELFKRGKDEIFTRIEIKKSLKNLIHDLELVLNDSDLENIYNKKTIKSFKNKFLTVISILDKLQLEWQKYDLKIRN